MGHEIGYYTFKGSKSKKSILNYCSSIVEEDSDDGYLGGIEFVDNKLFDSKEEAREYIESTSRSRYDNRAVKFRVPENSKSLRELNATWNKRKLNYQDRVNKFKSEIRNKDSIKCRHCKSNVNTYNLNTVSCPNCHNSLLTKVNEEKYKKLEEEINQFKEEYYDEYERLRAESENFNWLVRIEYHI